ncbi:hypothetical protein CRUP_001632, partial [Coryphaenoides rupestris]
TEGFERVAGYVVSRHLQLHQRLVVLQSLQERPPPQQADVVPPEGDVPLQHRRQLRGPLVGDLVVAEVQLGQRSVGGQALAELGEGLVPHAQRVPLQHQPAVPTRGTRHQSRWRWSSS